MALDKFTENVNVNQEQPDQPTLSAQQLKQLLDTPGNLIKTYINEVLTEQIDTLISQLNDDKVDKITGKGLSTEDFTTALLNKLNGIETNANRYVLPTATGSVLGGVKSGSNITNSSGILSLTKANVTGALGYTPPTKDTTYGVATTSANGLMSASDKTKLNGIATGANKTVVSNSLTDTSTTNALSAKQGTVLRSQIQNIQQLLNSETIRRKEADGAIVDYVENAFLSIGGGTISGDLTSSNGSIKADKGAFKSKRTYTTDNVTNATNLFIGSDGWIHRTSNTSSQRFKKDIKKVNDKELNPENLYDLEVKQFKYKKEYQPNEKDARYDKTLIGFIAEDVEKVFPIAVDYTTDEEGNKIVENWNERYIVPAMLKLIQDHKKKIDELEQRVASLESEV